VQHLTSRDNARFKAWLRLATSTSARHEHRQALLDGIHLCHAWLERHGAPRACLVDAAALENVEVAALLVRLEAMGVAEHVWLLEPALMRSLSSLEHGVGVVFWVDIPVSSTTPSLVSDAPALLLDRIQDPGNLGSILRSAAAAGLTTIFCSTGCAAVWSPKVLRAGMGAQFSLELHEHCDLAALLREAAAKGHVSQVFATSPHASIQLFDSDVRTASWLLGNEGQGVDTALMALGVTPLAIPQPGSMESLNVAAAAAICLFEQVRQRAASGQPANP